MKFENQKKLDIIEARVKIILNEVTNLKKSLDDEGLKELNNLLTEIANIINEEIQNV